MGNELLARGCRCGGRFHRGRRLPSFVCLLTRYAPRLAACFQGSRFRNVVPFQLIWVNIIPFVPRTLGSTAASQLVSVREFEEDCMRRAKRLSIRSTTVTGIIASALFGLAGVTLGPAPAHAVIYCTYVGYPAGCVARAGVVLRPRPVARAAVRHNAGGNLNGGVNRVGARR